jgi:hypothetical protein
MYVGFIGPRGIVALATSFYAILTVPAQAAGLEVMFYTVFVIIFLSGATATLLGQPLARLLGVAVPAARGGILLVGPNELAYQLAQLVKDHVPVAFLNTENELCEAVRWQGHQSIYPDALDEDVYRDASEEGFTRLLAVTEDDAVNQLVSLRASHHLGAGNVYCARGRRKQLMEVKGRPGIQTAFGEEAYVAAILSAMAAGQAEIITNDTVPEVQTGLLPLLAILPQGGVQILTGGKPPPGRLICLQYRNPES